MKCFLCSQSNFVIEYVLKAKNILKCKNDGLILGTATADKKINIYRNEYFDNPPHPEKSNQIYFLKKLEAVKLLTSNFQPQILDIGCGWGDFEEVLEKKKIPYLGIDINKEAVKICRKKGLNCEQITIENRAWKMDVDDGRLKIEKIKHLPSTLKHPSSKLFDAITMFQIIEHNKNPLPLLLSAKKLLKKNGMILITTPNNNTPLRKLFTSRWSVYNESSHYVFYSAQTLRQTLKLAGFKNITVKLDKMRFLSSNYIFNRLNQMYFPTFNFSLLTFNFPVPTDPFGDLVATAFID